jgi:ABC-type multidrug transport system permease subunit
VKNSEAQAPPADRGGTFPPLVELTLARIREYIREPEALFWAYVFPILMAVALAIAFPGRGAPTLVGLEPGPAFAATRDALAAAPDVTVREIDPADETRALREGEVHLVVVPTTPPTYRFDPTRTESRLARLVVDNALKDASGRTEPWEARDEPLRIPGSRYVDWLIPGIVGLGVMGTSMWGIGFSIVTARMRHLLKRLVASPMRRRDYLLAQLLARLVFLGPEVAVPLVFGVVALGMPMRGSWLLVAVVSVIGAIAFGALGLLFASRVRTFEAISGLMNIAMLPMWILSGVFFSASNFPDAVQPFVQALPLTALVDALRAVVLDDASIGAIRSELAILSAWAIVPFALALRIFRWR